MQLPTDVLIDLLEQYGQAEDRWKAASSSEKSQCVRECELLREEWYAARRRVASEMLAWLRIAASEDREAVQQWLSELGFATVEEVAAVALAVAQIEKRVFNTNRKVTT